MSDLEKTIEELYIKAGGIQELICEGGAEGAYTSKDLSSMQRVVNALEQYAKSLEKLDRGLAHILEHYVLDTEDYRG